VVVTRRDRYTRFRVTRDFRRWAAREVAHYEINSVHDVSMFAADIAASVLHVLGGREA
jgi:hypothetical protein